MAFSFGAGVQDVRKPKAPEEDDDLLGATRNALSGKTAGKTPARSSSDPRVQTEMDRVGQHQAERETQRQIDASGKHPRVRFGRSLSPSEIAAKAKRKFMPGFGAEGGLVSGAAATAAREGSAPANAFDSGFFKPAAERKGSASVTQPNPGQVIEKPAVFNPRTGGVGKAIETTSGTVLPSMDANEMASVERTYAPSGTGRAADVKLPMAGIARTVQPGSPLASSGRIVDETGDRTKDFMTGGKFASALPVKTAPALTPGTVQPATPAPPLVPRSPVPPNNDTLAAISPQFNAAQSRVAATPPLRAGNATVPPAAATTATASAQTAATPAPANNDVFTAFDRARVQRANAESMAGNNPNARYTPGYHAIMDEEDKARKAAGEAARQRQTDLLLSEYDSEGNRLDKTKLAGAR